MGVLPWFPPGILVAVVIAFAACGPLGRVLGVRRPIAWAIIVSFGAIVAATLTPLHGAFDFDAAATSCDLSRFGPAPLRVLLRLDDASLNVALFIPLGVAVGLMPAGRPRVALILGSIALPFAIEIIQLVAPMLDRGCQSADVADNVTGLLLGLVIGTGLRFLEGELRSRRGG
jgi:hypothetical protein